MAFAPRRTLVTVNSFGSLQSFSERAAKVCEAGDTETPEWVDVVTVTSASGRLVSTTRAAAWSGVPPRLSEPQTLEAFGQRVTMMRTTMPTPRSAGLLPASLCAIVPSITR